LHPLKQHLGVRSVMSSTTNKRRDIQDAHAELPYSHDVSTPRIAVIQSRVAYPSNPSSQ
jgi:hypothetical protein